MKEENSLFSYKRKKNCGRKHPFRFLYKQKLFKVEKHHNQHKFLDVFGLNFKLRSLAKKNKTNKFSCRRDADFMYID